eukprot:COSAG06_NODE_2707_length_6406_cov_2.662229_1_plen_126_part_00
MPATMRPYLLIALTAAAAAGGIDAASAAGAAQFGLSNLFSDSMVLQADAPTLFGTCQAGSTVKVSLKGASESAACATDGTWKVVFPPQQASNPDQPGFGVSVDGGCGESCTKTLKDVLLGDVWVW